MTVRADHTERLDTDPCEEKVVRSAGGGSERRARTCYAFVRRQQRNRCAGAWARLIGAPRSQGRGR